MKKIDIKFFLSKIPKNRPLNELDIQKFARHIPFFIGTRMRDEFQDMKCQPIEAAVVNLNLSTEPGSHWVTYYKIFDEVFYYDSFGNLPPPEELIKYFGKCEIFYNHAQMQQYHQVNCGALCLQFLFEIVDKMQAHNFFQIIQS